ncbi:MULTISPECIES: SusC/RagA family TonB-linked outer membrane protein [unclassified Cellulophaga]|uniref:SusC/RagA family TonB-linked outer membrane protein n=1 Tax=unclassified Cellulophaga TaxID=2634405 RepID=UPI0026E40F24|nr:MULTISPECIES: SusC/RagA family TonB-linked outer membrane protein [unclassified Cellulophaga]MDO6492223.1 SusC/RagA family TonB-linked outer membrane protein [Cellulophaga sp. 2_MG-2023]MDO6493173.1 SusC/RagA family TonB-linked outer membrane protein [Cellulophaga sp. 3_MG-2023]
MKIKLMNVLFCYRRKLMMTIMKAFIFLWCTAIFSFTTTNSFSQNAKISIKADAIVSVDMVFDIIMEQTDYKFIYSEGFFDAYPKIALHKGIIKANDLLDKTLKGSDVSYEFLQNKTIAIVKKTNKKSFFQTQITGKVVDEFGNPLLGMNVFVTTRKWDGTEKNKDFLTRGTTTDFDGNFKIMGDVGNYLAITGIGYERFVSQIVKNKTSYKVTLKERISELEEVVLVSTGYQKITKERSTGAYASVKKSQLEKPASNISERLNGVLSGVQSVVDADGNSSIQIRGLTTLGADKEPLIVLNGFPVEGGFSSINPNDVESVTVLKDAAASSIWGAKASNGVIVITTKNNTSTELKVSASSFVRISPKLDVNYSLNRATSKDQIAYLKLAFDGSNFGRGFNPITPNSLLAYGASRSAVYTAFYDAQYGGITNDQRDALLSKYANLDNTKQIEDNLLQNPMIQQHNINISGGNSKMSNNLSLLYEDSRDFFQGNNINKYLINFRNTTKLTNKLQLDFSAMLQYNEEKNNGASLTELSALSRSDMLKNEDGSLVDMSYLYNNIFAQNMFRPDLNLFPYGGDLSYNPITDANNRDLTTKRLNTRVQAALRYDITKNLNVTSSIQYEIFDTKGRNFYNENNYRVREAIILSSIPNASGFGVPNQVIPSGSILQTNNQRVNAYTFRNQLNFNRTFADKHAVTFLAGFQAEERVAKSTVDPTKFGFNEKTLQTIGGVPDNITFGQSYAGYAFGRPVLNYLINSPFIPFSYTNQTVLTENIDRFVGVYSNIGYTYDNKYTVTGSYRTDSSNLIADDTSIRSNPFWSVGLSWNMHNESFLNNVDWLNSLSLRSTYGVGGNVDSSTSAIPLLSLNPVPDAVTGEALSSVSNVGNPLLRWEKTKSLNVGVDFAIFNNKLNGSVNYYNKQSSDLIVLQSIPNVNGNTTAQINNGAMENKGFEIDLGTSVKIKGNDIVWNGSVNYSHNDNKIKSFFKTNYDSRELTSVAVNSPSFAYTEGYNANTLWSYQYAGVNNVSGVDAPSFYGLNGELVSFLGSATGNGVDFLLPSGTSVSPTFVGTSHSFKVYDFNLSFILQGKFGHKFRRPSFDYQSQTNRPINSYVSEALNAGDDSATPPIITDNFLYFRYGTYAPYIDSYIEDASHIRLQEVNVTYSLPSTVVDKLGVNSLQFYLQGNNLGTILFNDFGEDPEYPRGSIQLQPSYTFGINLTF